MAAFTSEGSRPDRSGAREPAPVPVTAGRRTPRHEIRALLRAHLAAASGYRHLTRHCAVCARLLRLAMDPLSASGPPDAAPATLEAQERPGAASADAPAPGPPPDAEARATPPGAPEQTARPVMGPEAATSSTAPEVAPHALIGCPTPAGTAARAIPAGASSTPGGAEAGPDGRIDPAWAEDESPPAA